jgi:hypothetical protein
VKLRREHGMTAALGLSAVLAIIDLQWSYTLRYKLAQPDFYVYYLAAQLGRARGWGAIYDPAVFLPPVTAAVGKPLPYLNPPELAWLIAPLSFHIRWQPGSGLDCWRLPSCSSGTWSHRVGEWCE